VDSDNHKFNLDSEADSVVSDNHKFNLDLEVDSTKVDHIKDDPIKVSIKVDDLTTKVSDNKEVSVDIKQEVSVDIMEEVSVDIKEEVSVDKEVSVVDKFVPKQPPAVTGARLPKAPIIVARATTRHPNPTSLLRSQNQAHAQ